MYFLDNSPTSDRMEIIRSWRTTTCDNAVDLTAVDTCASNPHRKSWSEAKCAVIRNLFKECHSYVPPDPYYDRCTFDTCACDSGGDCECFCTAVAAYANECNRKGIHIYWRTQDLCPMQCDGYRAYDPCEPACPITCENYHIAWKVYNYFFVWTLFFFLSLRSLLGFGPASYPISGLFNFFVLL